MEYPWGWSEDESVRVDRGPAWSQEAGRLHRVAPHRGEHPPQRGIRLQGVIGCSLLHLCILFSLYMQLLTVRICQTVSVIDYNLFANSLSCYICHRVFQVHLALRISYIFLFALILSFSNILFTLRIFISSSISPYIWWFCFLLVAYALALVEYFRMFDKEHDNLDVTLFSIEYGLNWNSKFHF